MFGVVHDPLRRTESPPPVAVAMGLAENVREVLRKSEVPLDAALIAELVGAEKADVEALLERLERDGVALRQEEWSMA